MRFKHVLDIINLELSVLSLKQVNMKTRDRSEEYE